MLVAGLPKSASTFMHEKYAFAPLPLTDVIVTDQRQRALAAAGFISLAQCWNTTLCEFPSMPSLHTPAANTDNRTAAAIGFASQLPMMLGASRFAHCIKVMMREKIGSFTTAADCDRHIDAWLRQYTIASVGHDAATLARFPLQAASVTIREDRSQPGRYWCAISLTPHHRIDGVDAQIHLTSELARKAA
jgi:type VI secretion system protein ImpD